MSNIKYREIKNVKDEGFHFYLTLRHVAYFFSKIMNARRRKDGPNTFIKWSRDWEYPWVLIKSEIKSGQKVLDCGAGYSPVPFLWSEHGAEVHAIDRDIIISSKLTYFFKCFLIFYKDLKGYFKKTKKNAGNSHQSGVSEKKKSKIFIFFNYFYVLFSRCWKPDFWGPIPPKMLKKYNINYIKGDFLKLPYENNSFDVVSCVSVIEHMPKETQVIGVKEMARVVKPGGKLIITYDNYEDLTESFVKNTAMKLSDSVLFRKPKELFPNKFPNVIGICLVKGDQ
tara:strand:+ start:19241 stop:20086 length:846 start_codon:yes stop_codon:yes gene_type:complete